MHNIVRALQKQRLTLNLSKYLLCIGGFSICQSLSCLRSIFGLLGINSPAWVRFLLQSFFHCAFTAHISKAKAHKYYSHFAAIQMLYSSLSYHNIFRYIFEVIQINLPF